jgi:hypothetical protein
VTCHHIPLPGGGYAIACGPTQRCKCGRRATLLCDWKMPNKKSGTCDAPLCAKCTHVPAPDKDLCPKHATEWKARQVK